MSLSKIGHRAFENMNNEIGTIALSGFIITLLSLGIAMLLSSLMWIPFIGNIFQIINNAIVMFFSIAMTTVYLNVYRGDARFSDIEGIISEKNMYKYIKTVIFSLISITFVSLLLALPILKFIGISYLAGMTFYSSLSIIAILGIATICLVVYFPVIYIIIMFMNYVYFVAIDAKKDVRMIDLFSLSNRLLRGNRRKQFLMDLFFIGIFFAIFILIFALMFIGSMIMAISGMFLLSIAIIPFGIVVFLLSLYIVAYRSICVAGIYDELLLLCTDELLMEDVYGIEFVENIREKRKTMTI